MSSENRLVFNEIQNKFQCKSQISSYLNVILHFRPFFAEKPQKRGKSHIFGFISEKSQLTDLNHPVFVLVLVSYNFCMIPLVCALNFGYSNPVDRGVLNHCSVLLARSFFRFLQVSLLWVIFSVHPCIYSILWFHKTIFPIPMMKRSSTAFYIIDSSWLNLPKNVRVNLIKQDKWFFDINGFLSSGTSKKNLLT